MHIEEDFLKASMMPNLAFVTQLVPLRKISEVAKTMDGMKWQ